MNDQNITLAKIIVPLRALDAVLRVKNPILRIDAGEHACLLTAFSKDENSTEQAWVTGFIGKPFTRSVWISDPGLVPFVKMLATLHRDNDKAFIRISWEKDHENQMVFKFGNTEKSFSMLRSCILSSNTVEKLFGKNGAALTPDASAVSFVKIVRSDDDSLNAVAVQDVSDLSTQIVPRIIPLAGDVFAHSDLNSVMISPELVRQAFQDNRGMFVLLTDAPDKSNVYPVNYRTNRVFKPMVNAASKLPTFVFRVDVAPLWRVSIRPCDLLTVVDGFRSIDTAVAKTQRREINVPNREVLLNVGRLPDRLAVYAENREASDSTFVDVPVRNLTVDERGGFPDSPYSFMEDSLLSALRCYTGPMDQDTTLSLIPMGTGGDMMLDLYDAAADAHTLMGGEPR